MNPDGPPFPLNPAWAPTVEAWCREFLAAEDAASKCNAVQRLAPRNARVWENPQRPERLTTPRRPLPWQVVDRSPKTPKRGAMVHPTQRAHLLHTLAHHELQAAELFAWAILAFPDTPPTFRAGLLRIALEELEHLGLYRAHLERLGTTYPSQPVRDWFWERAGTCQTPIDFVAFMGLGLEGANLEHSARFAEWFRAAGDEAGAEALDRVERDEIGHVAFARQWFERWTESPLTVARWQSHLPAPLTPAVFRGRPLNRAARRRAGLSEAFLDDLERAAPAHQPRDKALPPDRDDQRPRYWLQRDRDPVVWILNLDAEEEWSHGLSQPHTPYERSARMQSILQAKRAPLLHTLVQPGDWCWPPHDGRVAPAGTRAIAWSPTVWAQRQAEAQGWVGLAHGSHEPAAQANHKACLVHWLSSYAEREFADPDHPFAPPPKWVLTEAEEWLEMLHRPGRETPAQPWRLRRVYGAAGRQALTVDSPNTTPAQQAWWQAAFQAGGLIVERALDVVLEVSTCGWIDGRGEVTTWAPRIQNVDRRGAWKGPGSRLAERETGDCVKVLQRTAHAAGQHFSALGYRGPFSIDSFAYRRQDGALAWQPASDGNARWTMAFSPDLWAHSPARP